MGIRFRMAVGDRHSLRVGVGDAVRDRDPFGVGVRLPIRVALAGDMRNAVRLPNRLAFGVSRSGVARQGTREHQRQGGADVERAVAGLPGGPGRGVFRQSCQHPAGILHRDRRQQHLQKEIFLDLRHAAHDQFILLQGELLRSVVVRGEQRGQVGIAAAGVLARVRMAERQHAVGHVQQGVADPGREFRIQRAEAHLGIGRGQSRFEAGRSEYRLRRRVFLRRRPADRPVALDDAQAVGMVDAGHQVDNVHVGVVQAAQHGAHLGKRALVAPHVERNGSQVHQAHGAVLVVRFPAFALLDLVPQIVKLVLAGYVLQPVRDHLQIIRDFEVRLLECLLQARQDGFRSLDGGGKALVDPGEEVRHMSFPSFSGQARMTMMNSEPNTRPTAKPERKKNTSLNGMRITFRIKLDNDEDSRGGGWLASLHTPKGDGRQECRPEQSRPRGSSLAGWGGVAQGRDDLWDRSLPAVSLRAVSLRLRG